MNFVDQENKFLAHVCNQGIPVTVFLVNGFQLRGEIIGYDKDVIVLTSDGKQQIIYKHAISTIVPAQTVPLN